MKKEFIKLSAVLCIITLVAALILAGVNNLTAPAIEIAEKKATETAMKVLLPEAEEFETSASDENLSIARKNGEIVGFCVKVSSTGYGGAVVMMVAIDGNMKVRGIEILSHGETAGLGAKITEDKFKSQFPGKDAEGLSVVKNPTTNPNEFEAVTGATISSRAVEDGVKQACDMVTELLLTKEGAE